MAQAEVPEKGCPERVADKSSSPADNPCRPRRLRRRATGFSLSCAA